MISATNTVFCGFRAAGGKAAKALFSLAFGPGFISLGMFTFIKIVSRHHRHNIGYIQTTLGLWGAMLMLGIGGFVTIAMLVATYDRIRHKPRRRTSSCSHNHTCDVRARVGNEHEWVEVCLDCGYVKVRLATFEWEPDDFTPPLLPQARAKMAVSAEVTLTR
jgi:hypothetical protein